METERKVPCVVCKVLKGFLELNSFFFLIIFLFIFGCPGSSVLSRIFSTYGKWGLLSSCNVLASHCGGFCCRAQASVVAACRLSSCGSRVLEHRLTNCGARA